MLRGIGDTVTSDEARALLARYTPQKPLSEALTALLRSTQDAQARARDALHLLVSSVQNERRVSDMPEETSRRLKEAVERALKTEAGT
jgi:hypothetical protein